MIKRFKRFLIAVTGISLLLTPALAPAVAHAQDISGSLCQGTQSNFNISGTPDSSCANDTNASTTISSILAKVINVLSVIVGVIAVIMIIVGGLKYITSGGESGNISGAKNTIVYALIGLVIVALAQVLVHFVLAKAGNT